MAGEARATADRVDGSIVPCRSSGHPSSATRWPATSRCASRSPVARIGNLPRATRWSMTWPDLHGCGQSCCLRPCINHDATCVHATSTPDKGEQVLVDHIRMSGISPAPRRAAAAAIMLVLSCRGAFRRHDRSRSLRVCARRHIPRRHTSPCTPRSSPPGTARVLASRAHSLRRQKKPPVVQGVVACLFCGGVSSLSLLLSGRVSPCGESCRSGCRNSSLTIR